jgi:hypothetical protein
MRARVPTQITARVTWLPRGVCQDPPPAPRKPKKTPTVAAASHVRGRYFVSSNRLFLLSSASGFHAWHARAFVSSHRDNQQSLWFSVLATFVTALRYALYTHGRSKIHLQHIICANHSPAKFAVGHR